jgi:hypothetical protein
MKRFIPATLSFFLFFLPIFSFAQTTILSEDFNSCEYPSDWSVQIEGGGTEVWYVGQPTNSNSDGTSIDGSCMLVIDDDAAGNNTPAWVGNFRSPSFDGTTFSTITLSVDVHHRDVNEQSFRIKVWTETGYRDVSIFDDITTGEQFNQFVHVEADLSFFASDDMHILFEFDDGNEWGWWAGIDNFEITGSGSATNLVLENFDNCQLPSGWTSETVTGVDDWQFGYVDNSNAWAATSMNGTCMAFFDDDGIGETQPFSKVRLKTPFIDVTNFANVYLDFDLIFRKYAELENFAVLVSDGNTEKPVATYLEEVGGEQFNEYEKITLDLSPFRSQRIQVIFQYEDGSSWGWWVGMDNVKISGEGEINDLCSTAIELQSGAACLSGSNTNALTTGLTSPCSPSEEAQLWYRFEPDFSGLASLQTGADFNDAISIFTGDCSNLTYYTCSNYDEFGFRGEDFIFEVQEGNTYFIRIGGHQGKFGISKGNTCVSIQQVATAPEPPANDPCISAITIPLNEPCSQTINYNAETDQPTPSLNNRSRADIWFHFEAESEKVKISSHADFADVITLFDGDCQNLTEIAGNEKGHSLLADELVPGKSYYIQISGFFATLEGGICLEVNDVENEPPANDQCLDATLLTVGDDCLPGNSFSSSFDGPVPICVPESNPNIWYKFIAPASGGIKINSITEIPHVYSLYTGDCQELEAVRCLVNPNRCEGYPKFQNLIPGQMYYLAVAGKDLALEAEEGSFCLQLLDVNDPHTYAPIQIQTEVTCIEQGLGELHYNIIGGLPPFEVQGNSNGSQLLTGQKYLVVVKDDFGCETAKTGIVSCGVPDCTLSSSVETENISCNGSDNGVATISVDNAIGNYTFQWPDNQTGPTAQNLSPGFYAVTVTDDNNCIDIVEFTIEQPPVLSLDIESQNEDSYQANDGSIQLIPNGGTQPYDANWNTGATGLNQNNLAPGEYQITLVDGNGCRLNTLVTIDSFICTLQSTIESIQNISCYNAEDGSIEIDWTTDYPPVIANWSNGGTGAIVTNLPGGEYTVTIMDAKNCPAAQTFTLSEPDPFSTDIVKMSESANGAEDGFVHIEVNGGTGPYTFLWSNGAAENELTNLAPGNYSLTITDQNGCEHIETITIDAFNCLVDLSDTVQNISCFGEADGFISVQMAGTAPFTYQWSNGESSNTISNLAPGSYTISATDADNCPAARTFTIEQPDSLYFRNITQMDVVCPEDQDGSVSIDVQGGTPPYNISWQNGSSGPVTEQLGVGPFWVEVADAKNCSFSYTGEIIATDTESPLIKTKAKNIYLDENGNASISAAQLDNGTTDNCGVDTIYLEKTLLTCDDLGSASVNFIALDISGNMATSQAGIQVLDTIRPRVTCPESVSVIACDGIIQYDTPEAFDNCGIEEFIMTEGLASGQVFPVGTTTVKYEATDLSGNTSFCEWTIELRDTLLQTSYQVEKPACNGEANGNIIAMTEGGSGQYTFNWSNNDTGQEIRNLLSGWYTVTISDGANCTSIDSIFIPEPPAIEFSLDSIVDATSGNDNGKILITVSGGTPPFQFVWTNVTTGETIFVEDPENLAPGTYSLSITDKNDCVFTVDNVVVDQVSTLAEAGEKQKIRSFPNPARDFIFLESDIPFGPNTFINIHDINGKLIKTLRVEGKQNNRIKIGIQQLAAGQYSLTMDGGEQQYSLIFTKVRS